MAADFMTRSIAGVRGNALVRRITGARANQRYNADLRQWQLEYDAAAYAVHLVQDLKPETTDSGIVMQPEEGLILSLEPTALIEAHQAPGRWEGRSSGFSFPIVPLGGSAIRYNIGSTRGTFVQGPLVERPVDAGNLWITTKRILFQGEKQTRDCPLGKLVAVDYNPSIGAVRLSLSNRKTPVTVLVGTGYLDEVQRRITLALAYSRDDVPALLADVQRDLQAVEAAKPSPPQGGAYTSPRAAASASSLSHRASGDDGNRRMATWGLWLSIFGICGITAVLGVIFGAVSYIRARGHGTATSIAAIIIGAVWIIFGIIGALSQQR